MKSFDTFVIIALTSSSSTISLTGIGLIALPISTATACGLPNGNKRIYEIIITNHNKHKNNMKEINKQINISVNYTENLYNIL